MRLNCLPFHPGLRRGRLISRSYLATWKRPDFTWFCDKTIR
jgi:hypothetical protein